MNQFCKIFKFCGIFAILFLVSCGSKDLKTTSTTLEEESSLYNKIIDHINKNEYNSAQLLIEKMEDVNPFSELNLYISIIDIYVSYKMKQYDKVSWKVDAFLKRYPNTRYGEYLLYIKVLASKEQVGNVGHDTMAMENTSQIVKEYFAQYGEDAEYNKILATILDESNVFLIENQMNIAYYYLEKGNLIAALNRYKEIFETYPNDKKFRPELLYRIIEIFYILSIESEAKQIYQEHLRVKFKENEWTKRAYDKIYNQ